ncbi:MAG: AI-2E family transporter [Eubacteriales bacterium]|nr:AI-2E family transporter [Christensenellaceae bacterium]MCI7583238.1 AI-2E family transporter [Christensenellaceae bacterium]MDY4709600.1 AI-2E family transporter [Eubacteriales bacterium]MDY6078193.1 AI-2E family transporter [Eubacteriales bacterium]
MVKKYCKLILFMGIVLAVVLYLPSGAGFFKRLGRALAPVAIAVFLAVVFNLPVKFLSEKVFRKIRKERIRFALSLAIVYIAVLGSVGAAVYFIVPEVAQSVKKLVQGLPGYGNELSNKIAEIFKGFNVTPETAQGWIQTLKDKITQLYSGGEGLFEKLKGTAKKAVDIFFAIILSIYLLTGQKRIISHISKFMNAILPDKAFKSVQKFVSVGNVVFSKFLFGQIIEATFLGVVTLVGMLIMKLPYAPLISAVVFISNLVPMLGAYVAGFVGFVLISLVSLKSAVVFLVFEIILQQIENNLTYPYVVGNSLGLSGFATMASVLIGGSLFGFWGIMLGVPLTAVVMKTVGHKIGRDGNSMALVPDVLKQSDEKSGGDGAEKGTDKGNGNGGS